ncbi:uncharacterized protein LOC142324972 isoform X2 [Lycorma delicatula]|uniref:uncharacterized protein LOC142324972 isoform X2 n=1 Tax=Lycorma delicatula TaxID=130591 RepID=UPI003F510D95
MSSTRHTRSNMEKGVLGLNDDEIQEEILNADLKALGINEDDLSNMATQEKENLLAALKQSTSSSSEQPRESTSNQNKQASFMNTEEQSSSGSSPNPIAIEKNDIEISIDSPEEYPSLPSPGNVNVKRNNQQRQQQHSQPQQHQPKKPVQTINVITVSSNQEESDDDDDDDDDSGDEYISDDDQFFNIPGFIDDNGSSLNQHARKKPIMRKVHFYTLPGQSNKDAVRSMLKYYNSWYKLWCSLEKNNVCAESDVSSVNNSLNKNATSPIDKSPLSPGSSNYSLKTSNEVYNNDRSPFKKSPSPEIEEIEITEIKQPENSRIIRNAKAKTLPRESRVQNIQAPSSSSTPTIALNFEEKWNPENGTWTNARRGRSRTNNRISSEKEIKTEPKVQCPICQLDFLQSKVESHAAVCEGFPPDTRSNQPSTSYSSKLEESKTKDDFERSNTVEITECNTDSKNASNKKRGN